MGRPLPDPPGGDFTLANYPRYDFRFFWKKPLTDPHPGQGGQSEIRSHNKDRARFIYLYIIYIIYNNYIINIFI